MRKLLILISFSVIACFIIPGCGGGKKADIGSKAALMPNADIVFSVDEKAIFSTKIGEVLKNSTVDAKSSVASFLDLDKASADKVKKILGLTQSDIVGYTFSAALEGVDLKSLDKNPKQLPFVFGIEFNKEISNKQLADASKIMIEKKGGTVKEDKGMVVLAPPVTDKNSPNVLICSLGKTVFIGIDEKYVNGAIARGKAGKADFPVDLTPLKRNISAKKSIPQAFGIFKLPQSLKDKIKKLPVGQSPYGSMLAPFKSLESIVGSAKAGQELDLTLSLEFDSSSDAGGAKTSATTLFSQIANRIPPLSGITPIVTTDNDKLIISFKLTEDKINTLKKTVSSMMKGR